MNVGLVGINHKLADLRLRELLAKACEKRFGLGNSTHDEHAFVLLSTCNRTEVYFSSPNLAETHSYFLNVIREEVDEEFEQKLYSYFGGDSFLHLTRVTAGLDSALIGETEIQGQVKMAYESAKNMQSLPAELHFLFQKCLKISKDVRSHLPLNKGIPDIAQAVWNTGTELFPHIQDTKVLFVGASEINKKICQSFKHKGLNSIALCNRSQPGAELFALEQGIDLLSWNSLENWQTFDWIIFGTKCPYYLIRQETFPLLSTPKLILDLSVPRNVDPLIEGSVNLTLLNIDQIHQAVNGHHRKLDDTLRDAESWIETETLKQMEILARKESHKLRVMAII